MLSGRFERSTGRPFVHGRIVVPRANLKGEITLLIDTGADTSALMPADAQRIGIDYSTLTDERDAVGIGGVSRSFTERVLIAFADADERLYVYQIDIVIPTAAPEALPSPFAVGQRHLEPVEHVVQSVEESTEHPCGDGRLHPACLALIRAALTVFRPARRCRSSAHGAAALSLTDAHRGVRGETDR